MSRPLVTTFRVVAATLLMLCSLVIAAPAQAADDQVSVVITGLSPSTLGTKGTVRMSGTVTNRGDQPWSDLQAYLLIRPSPLTTRADLASEAAADQGFAGTRIVEVGRFDELGDLAPGASTTFSLTMPVAQLPITGTDGIYPIGVQILGTDADGDRSNTAIARATTLLPRMTGKHPAATSTVVWPFLMPTSRTADDRIADADALLESIGPGGALRQRVDAAALSPASGRGLVVDPALISAVADLADGRDAGRDLADEEKATAARFRDDLVGLATSPSTWVLDYDRTDVLALVDDPAVRRRLFSAVERATDSIVDEHSLSRGRVTWPTRGGVTDGLLRALRDRGDDPVVVDSSSLPDWTSADGVLVERATSGGDLPLLVDDDVTRDVPGSTTPVTLRQRVLASAALASLAGGRRESLVLVPTGFDPGPASSDVIGASAPYLAPRSLDQVVPGERYSGAVPTTTSATTISAAQVEAADRASDTADLLSTAAIDSKDLDDEQALALASVLGVRWRGDRTEGETLAMAVGRRFEAELSSITVVGPPSVTLSSGAGAFPLTISNGSKASIRVGVRLESSNPALSLPDQPPIEIAAGERRTVTVDVDLAEQNTTTVTAHLTTPDGRAFGSTDEFIVRSSRVGVVLWATMGAAALFVVFALVRRFSRRRSSRPSSPAGEPDE